LEVNFESHGANLFYNKWLGKNWGVNNRFSVGELVNAYKIIGIRTSLFFEF
jgi:hypothetical protein